MKKIISYIIIGSLAVSFILNACAKSESTDTDAVQQEALEAWLAVNAPDAKHLGDGIYYEVLTEAPAGAVGINNTGYITLNYTLKNLNGQVGYTRSESIARRQGTFTAFTHYVPMFAQIATTESENTTLMTGVYRAVLEMKIGDVWRLYLPSKYGVVNSSVSNAFGYGGETTLAANRPIIVDDLEVVTYTLDPETRENTVFDATVNKVFQGLQTVSLEDRMLMEVYRTTPDVTDSEGNVYNPNEIPADSIAQLYYTIRFFSDDFILETNVDSIQRRIYGRVYQNDVYPYEYVHSAVDTSTTSYIILKTLYSIMPNLHYGDSVRVAYTSEYAYGADGQTPSELTNSSSTSYNYTRPISTEVQPYASLYMDIVVMDKDYDYLAK